MQSVIGMASRLLWFAAVVSIGFTHDHAWVTGALFVLAIAAGAVVVRMREGHSPVDREQPPPSN